MCNWSGFPNTFRLWAMLLVLVAQNPIFAKAESSWEKWNPLTQEQFDAYRYVFAAYDIHALSNEIIINDLGVKIFRIETTEFCRNKLCLTIVVLNCERPVCPSTAVFAAREVKFEKQAVRFFGGTQFLLFPLSKDRTIGVMFNRKFVSVWNGFEASEN